MRSTIFNLQLYCELTYHDKYNIPKKESNFPGYPTLDMQNRMHSVASVLLGRLASERLHVIINGPLLRVQKGFCIHGAE